jgi:uncharacterized membrane protein
MDKKQHPLVTMPPAPESKDSLLLPSRATRAPAALSSQKSTLRQTRMNELMDGCQQEILRQIIGPFGLTPAMFDDKRGGNVATVHNADQDIFPDEQHKSNYSIAGEDYSHQIRQYNWDDKSKRGEVHKENNRIFDSGGGVLSDATNRPMIKGSIDGDHTVSLKEAHADKGLHLRFSEAERKALLNSDKNMSFIEASLNRAKGDRSWGECLRDPKFVERHNLTQDDIKRIEGIDRQARFSIGMAKSQKLGSELITTGAQEAGRNALRQALGVLLYEFINGSFVEIKRIVRERGQDNLIDRIVESLKRVMQRVVSKLKAVMDAAISGGIQGFISNLLTFLINNFISTAKKVVTLIRESMKSLWEAIKVVVSPPAGTPAMEVARSAIKIISAAVVTALGMMLEESVKGFLLGFPFLAPIVGMLSPALTAILTGITGALVVYGIDRLFDWLSATDTETLEVLVDSLRTTNESVKRIAVDHSRIAELSRDIESKREMVRSSFDDFDKLLG